MPCGHHAVAFVCRDCRPQRRQRTTRLKTARESGLWQRRRHVGSRHFFTPSRKSRTTLNFGRSSSRRCTAEFLGVSERFVPGSLLATSEFRLNFLEPPLNHTWRTFFFFLTLARALLFPSDDDAAVCILLIAGRWWHIVTRPRQSRFLVVFRRLRVASFSLSGNCERAKRHFVPKGSGGGFESEHCVTWVLTRCLPIKLCCCLCALREWSGSFVALAGLSWEVKGAERL